MSNKRKFRIRHLILLITLLPITIITLGQIVLIYKNSVVQGQIAVMQQTRLLAAQLASHLEQPLFAGDQDQLPNIVSTILEPAVTIMGIPIACVTVTDQHSEILLTYDVLSSLPDPPSTINFDWLFPDEVENFTAPIYLNPLSDAIKRRLGTITIDIRYGMVKRHLFSDFAWNVSLILLTFGLAFSLVLILGSRIYLAIREVSDAVRQIKNGQYNVQFNRCSIAELITVQEGIRLAADAISQGQQKLHNALATVQQKHDEAIEQLQVQKLQAEQASEAKSLLLAKVSHEMRTPLYSIIGHTEKLQMSQSSSDDQHTLKQIQASAWTLENTINDLLDFTHLARSGYQPVKKLFDPWHELEKITDTTEILASEQDIYVDLVVNKDVPKHVLADQRGFHIIANNLISNAVKFTAHGGITVQLAIDTATDSPVMILTVADTGCGIPASKQADIFKPFEQIENGLDRRYGGNGLGLSIVHELCERLGGDIWLEPPQPQNGTTFKVRLPITLSSDKQSVRQNPYQPSIESASHNNIAESALVVSERHSLCASAVCRLDSLGFNTTPYNLPLSAFLRLPPPAKPYSLIVIQNNDLKLLLDHGKCHLWANKILCLQSHLLNYPEPIPDYVLFTWVGASRSNLSQLLSQASSTPDNSEQEHKQSLQGITVLLVEDYAINREIMMFQLQRFGVHVIDVDNGRDAIHIAQQRCSEIDLILMDIQLPGVDGITAIHKIRQVSPRPDLPIIGFTASTDKTTHQQALAMGSDFIITKPITEAGLLAAVQRAIDRQQVC